MQRFRKIAIKVTYFLGDIFPSCGNFEIFKSNVFVLKLVNSVIRYGMNEDIALNLNYWEKWVKWYDVQ